ncbi:hypothetical protein RE474_13460 [Methanolobus sediminis]|uniref:Uncharacterized protein n=1 Tax=Methanolobus sediminis TaxID=3072978 RepID=A0AA51UN41_9EURY|nr:hypothetical protein [Methanolobus sediminis]WMW25070.1 hypothetical protein RE474_13460 [Methanolobus sediminis]
MEVNVIKGILIILLFLLISPVNIVYAETGVDYDAYKDKWDLLYEDKSNWLCFDYSIDYARNHPGWGMVILSPSPAFRFQPHMVNYKIEGNMLYIHEPQANLTYELEIVNGSMNVPLYDDFPNSFSSQWTRPTYFYFIPNESGVLRTYYSLQDNRNEFFDYENISSSNISQTMEIESTMEELNQSSVIVMCENSTGNQTGNNISIIENTSKVSIGSNNDTPDNADTIKSESFTAKIINFAKSLFGI